MPPAISLLNRNHCLKLFLQGLSQSEIAHRTGISLPTISRVVDEFERYVELNGLEKAAARYGIAETVQELHSLSALLSKTELSIAEAAEGATIVETFNEMGIDASDRHHLIKALRHIEEPRTLQVVVELASLEEETGMTYEEILKEYRQLDNDVEKKRQEIHALEERKMTLEKKVANAEAEARAADKQRSQAVEELRRTLKEKQLTIDKFNQLYSLVEDRVERMGWTKSVQDAVNLLDKAGGLIRFINALTDEEADLALQVPLQENPPRQLCQDSLAPSKGEPHSGAVLMSLWFPLSKWESYAGEYAVTMGLQHFHDVFSIPDLADFTRWVGADERDWSLHPSAMRSLAFKKLFRGPCRERIV